MKKGTVKPLTRFELRKHHDLDFELDLHLAKARAKHRRFVKCVFPYPKQNLVAAELLQSLRTELTREQREHGFNSAYGVMHCELAEFMEAVTTGDRDAAISELFDLFAAGVRLIETPSSAALGLRWRDEYRPRFPEDDE